MQVYYSFNTALALHTLPLGFVLIVASLTDYETSGIQQFSGRISFILKGTFCIVSVFASSQDLFVLMRDLPF